MNVRDTIALLAVVSMLIATGAVIWRGGPVVGPAGRPELVANRANYGPRPRPSRPRWHHDPAGRDQPAPGPPELTGGGQLVSIQAGGNDTYLQWFRVDLYVNDVGQVVGVDLRVGPPNGPSRSTIVAVLPESSARDIQGADQRQFR